MIEEYDFDDPKVRRSLGLRRSPARIVRSGLAALVLALTPHTTDAFEWISPIVHQGVEIHAAVPSWRQELKEPDPIRAYEAMRIITEEIDKYPERFVADQCGLKTIYVVSGRVEADIPGRSFNAQYSFDDHAFWITTDRDHRPQQFEFDMRVTTVHEIDHACSHTLRTDEDIDAWSSVTYLPGGVTRSVIEEMLADRSAPRPPSGFSSWYAASTALSDHVLLVHVEDEAAIKELITYGWHRILAQDDPVIDAKVDILINRYANWSDGVMDREYFQNWFVP